MKKVVINNCYGGFHLSPEAVVAYGKLKGKDIYMYEDLPTHIKQLSLEEATNRLSVHYATNPNIKTIKELEETGDYFNDYGIERDGLDLIKVVEELGERANSKFSKLKIVEIPSNVKYTIEEYDGMEWIAEEHRTWS